MDPRILWKLSYGVYAVCGQKDGVNFGCIANSAMQVTAEPASIAVSINHDNFTHGCLAATGRFALCILPESYPPLAIGKLGFYSGRDTDKFAGLEYETSDGLPILKGACGYLICQVRQTLNAGTHTIFLAEVVDGALQSDAPPMTYAYYHDVIKGKSPKNAPTYRGQEQKSPRKRRAATGVASADMCMRAKPRLRISRRTTSAPSAKFPRADSRKYPSRFSRKRAGAFCAFGLFAPCRAAAPALRAFFAQLWEELC